MIFDVLRRVGVASKAVHPIKTSGFRRGKKGMVCAAQKQELTQAFRRSVVWWVSRSAGHYTNLQYEYPRGSRPQKKIVRVTQGCQPLLCGATCPYSSSTTLVRGGYGSPTGSQRE